MYPEPTLLFKNTYDQFQSSAMDAEAKSQSNSSKIDPANISKQSSKELDSADESSEVDSLEEYADLGYFPHRYHVSLQIPPGMPSGSEEDVFANHQMWLKQRLAQENDKNFNRVLKIRKSKWYFGYTGRFSFTVLEDIRERPEVKYCTRASIAKMS